MGAPDADPAPQRIGDLERDQAAEYLREHLVAGRLDQVEFDERLTRVLAARTAEQLQLPFHDLPAPRPGTQPAAARGLVAAPVTSPPAGRSPVAPVPGGLPAERAGRVLGVVSAATWPTVVMVLFATGSWGTLWWLIFIPIILSSVAGSLTGEGKKKQRQIDNGAPNKGAPED
jgi:hypothetical protein